MLRVLFFAKIKDDIGHDFFDIDIETPCSVSEVRNHLRLLFKDDDYLFSENYATCAVNHEISNEEKTIKRHDEIAFFPPVTGG